MRRLLCDRCSTRRFEHLAPRLTCAARGFSRSQGDPTYLIVTQDGTLENYGLNAVCTHLGCVVPWVSVSLPAVC
jgi:Rieske Fe-S protein